MPKTNENHHTVTIQQCPRCKEEACEVCCLHMSRPMTQQMGCCWIVTNALKNSMG